MESYLGLSADATPQNVSSLIQQNFALQRLCLVQKYCKLRLHTDLPRILAILCQSELYTVALAMYMHNIT